jgi:hypothetical protein
MKSMPAEGGSSAAGGGSLWNRNIGWRVHRRYVMWSIDGHDEAGRVLLTMRPAQNFGGP